MNTPSSPEEIGQNITTFRQRMIDVSDRVANVANSVFLTPAKRKTAAAILALATAVPGVLLSGSDVVAATPPTTTSTSTEGASGSTTESPTTTEASSTTEAPTTTSGPDRSGKPKASATGCVDGKVVISGTVERTSDGRPLATRMDTLYGSDDSVLPSGVGSIASHEVKPDLESVPAGSVDFFLEQANGMRPIGSASYDAMDCTIPPTTTTQEPTTTTGEPTTTTQEPTTTTAEPTTTTQEPTTTTGEPTTTTRGPTTTQPPVVSTTKGPELPYTGFNEYALPLGVGLTTLGGYMVLYAKGQRKREEREAIRAANAATPHF